MRPAVVLMQRTCASARLSRGAPALASGSQMSAVCAWFSGISSATPFPQASTTDKMRAERVRSGKVEGGLREQLKDIPVRRTGLENTKPMGGKAVQFSGMAESEANAMAADANNLRERQFNAARRSSPITGQPSRPANARSIHTGAAPSAARREPNAATDLPRATVSSVSTTDDALGKGVLQSVRSPGGASAEDARIEMPRSMKGSAGSTVRPAPPDTHVAGTASGKVDQAGADYSGPFASGSAMGRSKRSPASEIAAATLEDATTDIPHQEARSRGASQASVPRDAHPAGVASATTGLRANRRRIGAVTNSGARGLHIAAAARASPRLSESARRTLDISSFWKADTPLTNEPNEAGAKEKAGTGRSGAKSSPSEGAKGREVARTTDKRAAGKTKYDISERQRPDGME